MPLAVISRAKYYQRRRKETEKCQGVYLPLDYRTRLTYRIYYAHSIYRLKDWRIWLPDPLLASKYICF